MKLNGLVGGGTGKLGNSVFSQNAGRTIVRQYQSEVKNPNTARQQNSRARFTLAGELAKQFAIALGIGRPRVGALTSRNQFTRDIIPTALGAIVIEDGDVTIDYAKMPIAKGGMPMLKVLSATVAKGEVGIEVTFESSYDPVFRGYVPQMAGTAGVVLVALNTTTKVCSIAQVSTPASGSGTIRIPAAVAGEKFQIYCFAKWIPESHNDIYADDVPWRYPSDQSDSFSFGEITVAQN